MIQRRPPQARRLAAARTTIGAIATAASIVPAELLLRAVTLRNRPYLRIWFHRGVARSLGLRIRTRCEK